MSEINLSQLIGSLNNLKEAINNAIALTNICLHLDKQAYSLDKLVITSGPIGSGGFSKIYPCTIDGLNGVAKVQVKQNLCSEEANINDEIKKIGGHSNICKYYCQFEDNLFSYMIFERVTGEDLFTTMKKIPLSVDQKLDIAKQITEGLVYLHNNGIVHCDIKPENIMIDENCRIKIIDLGLALKSGTDISKARGTPEYIAYELIKECWCDQKTIKVSAKFDVWSLGVLIYQLVTRRSPFMAPGEEIPVLLTRVMKIQYRTGTNWNGISKRIKKLITKCMLVEPSVRMTSKEVLKALAPSKSWFSGLICA